MWAIKKLKNNCKVKLEKLALLFCDMKVKIFLILQHKNNVELEIYLHIITFIRKRA